MVVHFLTLWRHCADKSSAAVDKVGAFIVHFFINKKILLLRSYGCGNLFNIVHSEDVGYS